MKKYWTYRRYYWVVVKDFVLRKDSPQVQPIAPYRPNRFLDIHWRKQNLIVKVIIVAIISLLILIHM